MGICFSDRIQNDSISNDANLNDNNDPLKNWFIGNIKHVGSSVASLESIDEKKEIYFTSIHPIPQFIFQPPVKVFHRRTKSY